MYKNEKKYIYLIYIVIFYDIYLMLFIYFIDTGNMVNISVLELLSRYFEFIDTFIVHNIDLVIQK